MNDIKNIQLEIERKTLIRNNLVKNFERRKKLSLLEPDYEQQVTKEIKSLNLEISALERKKNFISSEQIKKDFLSKK